MKALITGIDGFTGRYMAAELHLAGYEVVGLAHKPMATSIPGVKAIHACNLCDAAGLIQVVRDIGPDVVVHLAAISFVEHGDAEAIYRTNLVGSRNLLEALTCSAKPLTAVLLASSANVYGNATSGVMDESTEPRPANDYAVSKLAMEYMARLYMDRLPIVISRPFNYTGVGQADTFLLPKIVNHVKHRAPLIELGNLDVARDISDVRTIVGYYRRLLESEAAIGGTFNVCAGYAYTLNEILDLVKIVSEHDFEVKVNPAFVRSNEVKILHGSRKRLLATVGEMPDILLLDTVRWMLNDTV